MCVSVHFEISLQLFVCPSLHILIVLVNKIWSELKSAVEEHYEYVNNEETKARNLVRIQTEVLQKSIDDRYKLNKTTVSEIKAIKVSLQETKQGLKHHHVSNEEK